MIRFSVEIADEAWNEIERQIRFIAIERQSPINAARWSNRLLKAIDALEMMPRLHTLDAGQTKEQGVNVYRMPFEKTYLIFYTIDEAEKRVVVVSFQHGAKQG